MQKYGRCTVKSSTLRGVEGLPVEVEVVVSKGLPGFFIVGMPDTAIQEAKERIKAALQACNFVMPAERIVVNLAPGSVRKGGSGFDLPIALGILVSTAQIPKSAVSGYLVVGELSLEGDVRAVRGLLSHAICARREGLVLLCAADESETIPLDQIGAFTLTSLSDCKDADYIPARSYHARPKDFEKDFGQIVGHEGAKRVLQIAAAGNHGVMMMGPPGSGKTLLASCLPSILPALELDEQLETAQIYSIAGEPTDAIMAGHRPFRTPHHSSTLAGLIGGGSPLRPGEVSLAHNGVLFLDELAEFKPTVMQALRQPMESGEVNITRADGNVRFPAKFSFVAATNPCPCGYYGDKEEKCTCSQPKVDAYQARIGGPLIDRIDLRVHVARIPPKQVLSARAGSTSAEMLEGVLAAREFSSWRRSVLSDTYGTEWTEGARKNLSQMLIECQADDKVVNKLSSTLDKAHFSGRGIVKTLSIARTIADLEQSTEVRWEHFAEALQYRTMD